MSNNNYIPAEIESKWQAKWDADGLYRSDIDPNRTKYYALTMLPYPSGDLHIGHWYAMTPSDARARFKRMQGYNVLFPIGFDAFGLPAENAAIKKGIHPRYWTEQNMAICDANCVPWVPCSIGAEIVSCDPNYYKWTQWFFRQLFLHGLAYRKKSPVDWCPNCNTTPGTRSRSGERTGIASDVVRLLRSETWSNGSSEQPGMLMNCCIMIKWIGRNGFVCCKPTGLAGRKGRQSFSKLKMVIPWKCLPPDRTRYGEQLLWCLHPSIPWCKASRHRSKNK